MHERGGNGAVALCVDVGGTLIKSGLVSASGRANELGHEPTAVRDGPDAVVAQLARLVDELASRAAFHGNEAVAVGLSVPGIVDEDRGIVTFAANLAFSRRPLRAELEAATGRRVALCHDVRAAALAEARVGAAVGVDDFCFIALGTGISAGLVLGGRVRAGAHGRGGEIGHVATAGGDDACACGAIGCLETVASAGAIARRYARRVAAAEAVGEPGGAKAVLAAADRGDEHARAVIDEATTALADSLAALQGLVDVELVVVGGGLALAGETMLEPLRRALATRCVVSAAPAVVASSLREAAGLVGAGLAAHALVSRTSVRVGEGVR